jgi:hypothetical protein
LWGESVQVAISFILDNKEALGIVATGFGAFLTMLGTIMTLRRNTRVLQTHVALEFFRRYADISKSMPDRLRFAKYEKSTSPPPDEEWRQIARSMIEYGNLCSEEFALWRQGRIPADIWEVWKDAIRENFEAQIWRDTWAEVSREYASFEPFMDFMKKLLLEAEQEATRKQMLIGV